MPRITVYCVQPFWRDGVKLAHGALQQHPTEKVARRAGESASRRTGGAIVYSVAGCPEMEHWERPRLLATHGDVPAIEF